MGKRIIAFEFGIRYIKVMEFIPTFRGPKVIRLKYSPISKKKDWKKESSNIIKKAILKCKKSNIEIISSIPGHLFFIRTYFFPFSNMRKIRNVVRFELEGDIPLPMQDVVVDCLFMSNKDKGAEVIAFALPRSTLITYMELFPNDYKPNFLTPDLVSLSFLTPNEKRDVHGIFELGIDKVALTAVSQGRLKIGRVIPSGFNKGPKIINEMEATLKDWRKKGIEISKSYFLYDGIKELDLEDLGSKLKIKLNPLQTPEPLKKSKIGQFLVPLIGLASSFMEIDFNILRTDTEEKGKDNRKRKFVALTVCLSLLIILAIGNVSLRYFLLSRKYHAYKKEGLEIFHNFLPDVKKVVNERIQLENAFKENKKKVELLRANKIVLFKPSRIIDLLQKESKQDGISLVAASVEENGIIFDAETQNSKLIEPFMKKFKEHLEVIEAVVQKVDSGVNPVRFKARLKITKLN